MTKMCSFNVNQKKYVMQYRKKAAAASVRNEKFHSPAKATQKRNVLVYTSVHCHNMISYKAFYLNDNNNKDENMFKMM